MRPCVAMVYQRKWRNQRGRCVYCGHKMTREPNRPNTVTRDHIVPRSAGGSSKRRNIALACELCNQAKGDMTAAEFETARSAGMSVRFRGVEMPIPAPMLAREAG